MHPLKLALVFVGTCLTVIVLSRAGQGRIATALVVLVAIALLLEPLVPERWRRRG